MTEYRIIYVDFINNKVGVSARNSMNLTDKHNTHIFNYHEKVTLHKLNDSWASWIKTDNRITLYVPLYLDGQPTCILDTDFFNYEKKKFIEHAKLVEELENEKKLVQDLRAELIKADIKPTRKKAIPKKIKLLVWNLYVGEDNVKGTCYCCKKTEIKITDFHCGHFVSEKNNGDTTVDNLRPVCSGCNLSMGSQNMDDFMKYMTK